MAGITGMGTTFNLPNYHGELFALSPEDTPFLSAVGGLSGGGMTDATEFEWQAYDLRARGQNTKLEGATAPTAQERVRSNVTNVCQIHQEKVSVSYTKQATTGQYSGANIGGMPNPVQDELSWQVEQTIKEIAGDVNWSFINGVYQKPVDNTTARQTRGILQAASAGTVDKGTNSASGATTDAATDSVTPASAHSLAVNDKVVFTRVGASGLKIGKVYYVQSVSTTVSFKVAETQGGSVVPLEISAANVDYHSLWTTDLTVDHVNSFAKTIYDRGGLRNGLGTFVAGSDQVLALTKAYADAFAKANPFQSGNTVGGVAVEQVITPFGRLNIMLEPDMPADAIALVSMDQVRPVLLNTPGKGVFFEEELAKTGSSDDVQLYGEIGLDYGSPIAHGVLRGLKVA